MTIVGQTSGRSISHARNQERTWVALDDLRLKISYSC